MLTNEFKLALDIARNYRSFDQKSIRLYEPIDWDKFFDVAVGQGIFPLVYKNLIAAIPETHIERYQRHNDNYIKMQSKRIQLLDHIATLAEENDIKIVVNKGLVYARLLYDDLYLRKTGDLDLMLNESDIKKMAEILKAEGLFQHLELPGARIRIDSDVPILKYGQPEPVVHEYYSYYKVVDEVPLEVELQRFIHNTVMREDMKEFLNNTKPLQINNRVVHVFAPEYMFIYILENTYTDTEKIGGFGSLKEYIDLHSFINKFAATLDLEKVKILIKHLKMNNYVKRVFENLSQVFPETNYNGLLKDLNCEEYSNLDEFGPTGRIIEWESNFYERLFGLVDTFSEISRYLKRYYMENYLVEYGDSNPNNFILVDEIYKSENDCSINYQDNAIQISLVLDEKIISDDLETILTFYNNSQNIEEETKTFIIKFSHNNVVIDLNDSFFSSAVKEGNKLNFTVPLSALNIKKDKTSSVHIAFNMVIRECIHKEPLLKRIIASKKMLGARNICWKPDILTVQFD